MRAASLAEQLQEMGGTQQQQQQQQQYHDASFNGTAASIGGSASARAPRRVPSLEPAPAVPHFRFGFLSAGHGRPLPGYGSTSTDGSGDAPLSFVNTRRGIMDATRSFESQDDVAPLSAAEKTSRALALAQREHHAAGLGYGDNHPAHYAYLSRVLPPRAPAPFFAERPCVFPLFELPPLDAAAAPPKGDLLALSYAEQLEHQRAFRRRTASGLGYGSRKTQHFAYLANTYWRNPDLYQVQFPSAPASSQAPQGLTGPPAAAAASQPNSSGLSTSRYY